MEKVAVADVALDPRSGGAEALFTYSNQDGWTVGEVVLAPLGNRPALGVIVATREVHPAELGFPLTSLKPLQGRVDGISLPPPVVSLARYVAEEYLCPLPVALSGALPPSIRDRLVTAWKITGQTTQSSLTPLQIEMLRVMDESGGALFDTKTKRLPAATVRALRLLAGKGLVERTLRVQPAGERRKTEGMFRLTANSDEVELFLHKFGRRKPAQAVALMALQSAGEANFSSTDIKALAGVTESTVKSLFDAGLLLRVDSDVANVPTPPTPNPAQQVAIEALEDAVKERRTESYLLFGVTGSGKTEVYLRAAAQALAAGRQVLYIVPEIALASQAIARLRDRFGRSVAVLHSELATGERLQNWLRIRSGEAAVVLGARSALFAPMANLGLIVMDEEHDGAYKQDSAPRYHAKHLALYLGQIHGCPVVLGSATPSIESFAEAEAERLTLLPLPYRAAKATLPEVQIVDLADGYRRGAPEILGEALRQELSDCLDRGEQAILFLNRRAYAPFTLCRECGHQFQCPNCAISLSLHRRDDRLKCHHCGYQILPPGSCPACKSKKIGAFGIGTEKVEEAIALQFPEKVVARLDRDVTRKKGALEEVLAGFRSGEIHVLVGTQMVAKGLDFPNVTVVGVIAADISLNLPDFRASERTYQLLSQVAGRAGRGQRKGRVIIQTFNPDHVAVQAAQNHDYLGFFAAIAAEREAAHYPPHCRLINIVLSGTSRTDVVTSATAVRDLLAPLEADGFELLGPVDCAVERLQTLWRRHLLVKRPLNVSSMVIADALKGFSPTGKVQMMIDVDPGNLM